MKVYEGDGPINWHMLGDVTGLWNSMQGLNVVPLSRLSLSHRGDSLLLFAVFVYAVLVFATDVKDKMLFRVISLIRR
jgi:hypothetical protein